MFGTPPQGRADYAFIQHIIASMSDKNGRCAILLPHGILFRTEESDVRKHMILSDKVEAVIGLGPNLFYNAPMEACVLICKNRKSEQLKGRIIFINAKNEVTRKNAESYLEQSHIEKIVSAYRNEKDVPDFKRIVDLDEIERNKYDLSIQKYVFINDVSSDKVDFNDALAEWESSHSMMSLLMTELLNML